MFVCSADIPLPSSNVSSLPSTEVSVLICTRGRGDSLLPTVRSILRPSTICKELIIIDQSSDNETEMALSPFYTDPRLRYVRSRTQGKGQSLNLGLQLARYPIVAITDDDCEVVDPWPACLVDIFDRDPNVAIAYGNVLPVEHDPAAGFIPTYFVTHDRLIKNIWGKLNGRGIGANTAVRRDIILELGGFDPELCPGGIFRACVDVDMTLRCVLSGYSVFEYQQSNVYHYGFRNWVQGRKLARNAFYGIGAAHLKPLRCGHPEALVLLLWEFMVYALLPSLWSTLIFRRPYGWNRVLHFLYGIRDGMRCPVNRQKMLYEGGTIASLQEDFVEIKLLEASEESGTLKEEKTVNNFLIA